MRVKKVFLGLTAATILYAIYNVIIDIKDEVFDGLTIVGLLFLLLVHCFWPAGQARLRQWVLPGAEKADAAFHQLADNLQSGQPLTDCVESFCRQVLDGA